METIDTIRAAIARRHGGLNAATDREIREFWRTLPADRQAAYLNEEGPYEEGPQGHGARGPEETEPQGLGAMGPNEEAEETETNNN